MNRKKERRKGRKKEEFVKWTAAENAGSRHVRSCCVCIACVQSNPYFLVVFSFSFCQWDSLLCFSVPRVSLFVSALVSHTSVDTSLLLGLKALLSLLFLFL